MNGSINIFREYSLTNPLNKEELLQLKLHLVPQLLKRVQDAWCVKMKAECRGVFGVITEHDGIMILLKTTWKDRKTDKETEFHVSRTYARHGLPNAFTIVDSLMEDYKRVVQDFGD